MWERMFDLVLGLKKEHRLMMVITLIYAVTLFGITVDVEAMENWLQLVGYTIRTLCIACIIQLSVFFLTNIFWKELNRGLNKTFSDTTRLKWGYIFLLTRLGWRADLIHTLM